MKLILLLISLSFASNIYAAIDIGSYVFVDDSNELIKTKVGLKITKHDYGETLLETLRENKKMLDAYNKSEVVYRIGDTSKKDIGAKIGMNKGQVLNKTYWGEPDRINTNINKYDKLELWTYDRYSSSSQTDAMLLFKNDKLIYIIIF